MKRFSKPYLLLVLFVGLAGAGVRTFIESAYATPANRLRSWSAGDSSVSASSIASRVTPRVFVPADAQSNGGAAIPTSSNSIWLESFSFQVPHTCTGITYGLGGTVGGSVQFTVYGSGTSGGRAQPVSTPGTADGAVLVANTATTAQAGTVSRGQTISFTGSVVFAPGQFYVGAEFLDANGTYTREAQTSAGTGLRKTITGHTFGTALSTLSGSVESVNAFPVLNMVCSQTPVSFP